MLAGWPIPIGDITLGQERALLIGNLVAFAFAVRTAVRLTLVSRAEPTPTVQELTFRVHDRLAFLPGQYLELEVPHRHPDARGTRREFSIASAPEDLPLLKVAFRRARPTQAAELVQEGARRGAARRRARRSPASGATSCCRKRDAAPS